MRQYDRDKLVTDNLRLVYHLFNKLKQTAIVVDNKEDIISEGTVGLVKAANTYDPTKGVRFSTYASRCINNEMLMYIRRINKRTANEVSLYKVVARDEEGNNISYADILPTDTNTEDCIAEVAMDDFMAQQKDIDREIVAALRQGHTQKEVAAMVGLQQPTVSRRICKLKKKFRKEYPL